VILWATGYRPTIPCLEAGGIRLAESGADLFLNVFANDHRGLYVVGFFETAGAAYPIVSKQSALLASVLAAAETPGSGGTREFESARAHPRALTGGMRYASSPRHAFYVQFEDYLKELDRVRKRVERAAS